MPYKVLIVDDNQLTRQALAGTLDWASLDCEVLGEAADGVQGMEMIRRLSPDIVVTDVKMPGMDGLEMARLTREAGLKVIFISGYQEFDLVHAALKTEAVDYILKPVKNDELAEAVASATAQLARQRALAELEEEPSAGPDYDADGDAYCLLVQKALRHIGQHFRDDISLGGLADAFYVHPAYLSAVIKKETGQTFTSLLTDLRLKEARRLLATSHHKIGDVAALSGFSDYPYFFQVFKKYEGLSPGEYRRRHSQ